MADFKRQYRPAEATVLVVEDEELARYMIAEALRDAGITVIESDNADEAFAYLRSDPSVRVVFTDVQMPRALDGLELVNRISAEFPAIRLIMTSGHPLPGGYPANAAFLPKPYSLGEVFNLVHNALAA